jgi:tRNA (cmo5U34)-methyltransferase
MEQNDTFTAHSALEYDRQIKTTIPYYDNFHEETIHIIKASGIKPGLWFDTGCGTGTLIDKAYYIFPETRFVLADPSASMLDCARQKLKGKSRVSFLEPVATREAFIAEKADIVTAVQSHHYLKPELRMHSVENCFSLLKPEGIFITFENIKPMTGRGLEIGKQYWKNFQVLNGKTTEEAEKHLGRFGVEYFPLTVEEHLSMLRGSGFASVELIWYSYMQAGFIAVK